jgi:hypothetical protein
MTLGLAQRQNQTRPGQFAESSFRHMAELFALFAPSTVCPFKRCKIALTKAMSIFSLHSQFKASLISACLIHQSPWLPQTAYRRQTSVPSMAASQYSPLSIPTFDMTVGLRVDVFYIAGNSGRLS